MPRSHGMSERGFAIVIVATLAMALLPQRWLGMNNDLAAIMKLPVTPLSDLGTVVAGFLRPAARPKSPLDDAPMEQLQENVEFYKQLYLAADQRTRELEEKLRQIEMIPEETLRRTRHRIPARITARSPASSYGVVELKRGSRDGVEPGAVALYAGVHLLGQITDDVTSIRSTLLPVVNPGTGHIRARVEPRTGADIAITERPAIQLRPENDGTLIADEDRMKVIAEGDVVRLEDDTWPVTAQQMVLGRVESVMVNEREPLRHRIVVRPMYQVADVREVILLIEDATQADGASGAAGGGP